MSSKIIIIATIVLLVVSFATLFAIEAKNHSLDYKKSWSVVYFENPRDESLDFVIENHEGTEIEYNYKIIVGDEKVIDNKMKIDAGAKQKISPALGKNLNGKRVAIIVSRKDTEYKIYKDLK